MSGRVTLLTGAVTAVVGECVLLAWAVGATMATSVVSGWRVMVPSTAFGFVCVGGGLSAASTLAPTVARSRRRAAAGARRAGHSRRCTVFEYIAGVRLGVESWLGISFRRTRRILMRAACRR